MVKPAFLHFEGVDAPIDLGGSSALSDLARIICPGWPFDLRATTDTTPFFQAIPDGPRFLTGVPGGRLKRVDAVNALCDVIAALPDDRGFLSDALLCLHTAAVKIGGGLVLFPNTKKAGKSTLTVALSDLGQTVFTDDYLRVRRSEEGEAEGVANGVLPRLRLPIPPGLGNRAGPSNRQYLYPEIAGLARHGESAPLKALVFLDRRVGEVAHIEKLGPDEAMRAMLYQNFGRHLHSGTTLAALAPIVEALPRYRLIYDHPDAAATFLTNRLASSPVTPVTLPPNLDQTILDDLPEPKTRWRPRQPARQVSGVTRRQVGEGLYLADPQGRSIEHLDLLASAIWDMLANPVTEAEIVDVVSEAYPNASAAMIAEDVASLLHLLAQAGLIETP